MCSFGVYFMFLCNLIFVDPPFDLSYCVCRAASTDPILDRLDATLTVQAQLLSDRSHIYDLEEQVKSYKVRSPPL